MTDPSHANPRPTASVDASLFRQVFETTADAFFLIRLLEDGRFAYEEVNKVAEAFLCTPAEFLVGKTLEEAMPPDLAAYFHRRCEQCLAEDAPYTYDEVVDLPSGRSYFSTSLIPLREPDGSVTRLAGVCRNVTERRREEESRRERQKWESLGVMAGGVGHDFNNLLTVVLGHLTLLQSRRTPGDPDWASLASMEQALLKAVELTRQLMAYAGRGRMAVVPVDLNRLVRDMEPLMVATVPRKVGLTLELASGLPSLDADPSQLQQVIMSLILNGAEAIGDQSGRVGVRTGLETLDRSQLHALVPGQDVRPGPLVTLEVTDSGQGIAADLLPSIFDPFVSTKDPGRGLGLSALLGIVKGHGGGVRVRTTPGEGTSFWLCFPARSETPGRPAEEVTQAPAPRRARVLLVDDEPDILDVARSMLEAHGYTVRVARDGQEAVEVFHGDPDAFDLVMLDLSMPRMDGLEAFRHIRALRPVPVLFCSGYSREEVPPAVLATGTATFMPKPYRMKDLEGALNALLN